MIEHNVILNVRQGGKTWTIMHEIHDLIIAGRRADVLVVFPSMEYLHWWTRMWQGLFSQIPPPRYISITGCERARGLQVAKMYVEDIDRYDNGIYDERFQYLWPCLRSPFNDEEVIFTCSPLGLNQRSHSKTEQLSPQQVAEQWLREKRRKKQLEDDIMVAHMLKYIEDSNG